MHRFARYAAFHEAGHAVANTVLFGGCKEAKLWKLGRRTVGHCAPLPDDDASCRKASVVSYAGPVAHARFARVSFVAVMLSGGSADLATVDENCRYVAKHNLAIVIQGGIQGGVKAFERRWHVVAERDARALVKQHWDWITRVASHLAEHGHITGAMVKELE